MKIEEMTDAEKLTLGTLVRVAVAADGVFSAAESEKLTEVAEELGADSFWTAVDAAGQQSLSEETLAERIRAVERQDARETIYDALFKVSVAGTIDFGESRLLERLVEAWSLKLKEAPEEAPE